jgi:VWFA-related protein
VTVADASGAPVESLSAADFDLLEDGTLQEIQYFSPAASPVNVLLLFDSSGSTQHKWVFMQRAILALIANLRPQDQVAIGSFGYELTMHAQWEDSKRNVLNILPDLVNTPPAGGTNLYRTLERALSRQFRGVTNRRAVVVLTDGRDTSLYLELVRRNRMTGPASDREFQNAFQEARKQRIPIYFAAINTDKNLDTNTSSGDEYQNLRRIFPNSPAPAQFLIEVRTRMEQLAEVSGGSMVFPQRVDDLVPVYERMGRDLGTSYTLGYVSSNPKQDGSYRRIEVRTRTSGHHVTQSRSGYTAR